MEALGTTDFVGKQPRPQGGEPTTHSNQVRFNAPKPVFVTEFGPNRCIGVWDTVGALDYTPLPTARLTTCYVRRHI